MGGCLGAAKPRLLKQPAQATTHIRFTNFLGTPHLLADVIEALRAGGLRAAKNDPAIFDRGGADDTAAFYDTPHLRDDALVCYAVSLGSGKRAATCSSRYSNPALRRPSRMWSTIAF